MGRWMLLVMCATSASTGCTGWNDIPGASVRPVAPEEYADSWHAEVEDAIEIWRAAIEPFGCETPFHIAPDDPDAHDVELIRREDWQHDDGWSGVAYGDSPWEHGYIAVKYSASYEYRKLVLVHELGHALGLEHDRASTSVMHDANKASIPNDDDARRAALAIGCDR